MVQETALAKKEEARVPVLPPRITPETIHETMQSIALLQGMVKDILIRGIDYGRIPGTPQDSLWDPGASQIIGSFNCYPGQRRILKLEDSDQKIVALIEVPIISRATGQEVGTGIGAASTLETKYKYRWVPNPQEWGYDEATLKTFKTKRGRDDDGNETILYRIPNPEHSELLNTIVKMASKRAEVDAAESLPGVSSVLRQIFSGKKVTRNEKGEYEGPVWQRFWGEVRRLGLTDKEAHIKLGVISMKDWLAKGRSLGEALNILRKNESEDVEESEGGTTAPLTAEAEPEEKIEGEGFHIQMDFLKESLKALKWTEDTCKTFLVSKYKVSPEGTLAQVIGRLTREQAEEFTKEIAERVAQKAEKPRMI